MVRPAPALKIGLELARLVPVANSHHKEEFDEQKGLEKIKEVTLIKKSARCAKIRC